MKNSLFKKYFIMYLHIFHKFIEITVLWNEWSYYILINFK